MPRDLFLEYGIEPPKKPRDLFAENGIKMDKKEEKELESNSWVDKQVNNVAKKIAPSSIGSKTLDFLANNPLTGAALGAGDTLRDIPLEIGNIFGADNSKYQQPSGEGIGYGIGKIAGNVGAFVGGGEGLQAAKYLASLSKLPKVAKAAQLANATPALNRIAGGAALGAVENPEDRYLGAALGGGLTGLPEAFGAGKNIVNYFRPDKYAKEIIEHLGSGKSLEESAKEGAKQLSKIYNSKQKEAFSLYNPIFKNPTAEKSIREEVNPSGYHAYRKEADIKISNAPSKIESKITEFNKNPTFKNAHDLQSDFRKEIQKLKSSKKDSQQIDLMEDYINNRNILKKQMNNFLKRENPELAKEYKAANDYYRENLGHYLDSKKISDIATGKIKNPKNFANIFRNPEPGIEKVAHDIGEEGVNRILYSAIGHNTNTVTADSLLSKLSNLDKNGLESYISKENENIFRSLGHRMTAKNLGQTVAAMLAAGKLGQSLGGGAGAAVGAILGGLKGNSIIKSAYKKVPKISTSIKKIENAGE